MKIVGQITYKRLMPIGVGQGMNSQVWLAQDDQLGGTIVVKEIPKTNFGNNVTQYFREAQAMFAADHPNVVPIRAAFQTVDLICLAMDHFKKGSLQDRIQAGPITLRDALRTGQGILAGLGHIHAKNFIHFDIKPSNVFFDRYNRPTVADFGQTRKMSSSGVVARPPLYPIGIPPECYSGVGLFQSDIYHVGLTLYRAVNGDPLFNQQIPPDDIEIEHKTIAGTFPSRSAFMPHVPKRLRTVIRKALSVDPADRFQSPSEFTNALAGVSLQNDWHTTISPTNEITWRVNRKPSPDRLICLVADGQRWSIQMFTEADGNRRKWCYSGWTNGLTRGQAMKHLKKLFESLE